VASGRVDLMAWSLTTAEPYSERLTALAIASGERDRTAPDIPTLTEATGIPGFEIYAWALVLARAETPAPHLQRIRDELVKVLATPDVRERLRAIRMQPGGSTDVSGLQQLMARDAQAFAEVVWVEKIEER